MSYALLQLAIEDPELASFASPAAADGMCGLATDLFHDLTEIVLPEARLGEVHFTPKRQKDAFAYQDAPHPWYRSGCRHPGHCVAVIGNWLVDWTARQFDPEAPFPLVFQLDAGEVAKKLANANRPLNVNDLFDRALRSR